MSLVLILNSNQTEETILSVLATTPDSVISISALVAEQLPDFVRQDHTRLTEFLEAYYEWMEQTNETLHSTFVLQDFSDVDTSITSFIKHFKSQYLENFPEDLAYDASTKSSVDQKRLIKRIKEFYKAKGSEKAYKLLFRIIHDTEIENFYYPKIDIIKPSSGKWITNKSLKTSFNNDPDIWSAIDKTITQNTKTGRFVASAIVRDVKKYNTKNSITAELYIDEINGEFSTSRDLVFHIGGETGEFTENVYSVVEGVVVSPPSGITGTTQSGSGYEIGEIINILTGTGGSNAICEISEVNGIGGIISIEMINSGVGYQNTDNVTFDVNTVRGISAGFVATFGPLTTYPGYYFGTDGQPSSNKKLFDNNFYQDFSYEIKTNIALKSYKKEILNLIHPAGTKLFNMMLMKNTHIVSTNYKTSAKKLEISILGHYTPYTWNTSENLRYNTQSVDLYPVGYNNSIALVPESGPVAHKGTTADGRSGSYWGLCFNDYAGRTAAADNVIAGHTFAYDLGIGGTWDAGLTGPMYNLSQGVFFTAGTAGASAAYDFVGTAAAGDFDNYGSYWVVYPHPNARDIDNIPAGSSFSQVGMKDFFYIDRGKTAGIETPLTTFTTT